MVLPGPFHSGFVRPGPFIGPCSAALARLFLILLSLQEILGVRNIFSGKMVVQTLSPSQLKFVKTYPVACRPHVLAMFLFDTFDF